MTKEVHEPMPQEQIDPVSGFYYNTRTGEVEQGLVSDWTDRMGPYRTHQDAAAALQGAASRNARWDAEDRAWDGDGDDA